MTQSICGRGLLLCVGIVVLLSPLLQRASAGQAPASPVRAGIISIRLESNKAVYRVGEAIKLRVTLINHTANKYLIPLVSGWNLCSLSVRNGHGQPTRTTLRNRPGVTGDDRMYVLPPNGSLALIFWPQASGSPQNWTDIKYWLYDLDKPGDYVIVGHPNLWWVSESIGDHLGNRFTVSPQEKSNTLHIRIVK
jgi:hypothetical protein